MYNQFRSSVIFMAFPLKNDKRNDNNKLVNKINYNIKTKYICTHPQPNKINISNKADAYA